MAQPVLSMKGRSGAGAAGCSDGRSLGAAGPDAPFRLAARHFAAPRWFAGGQTRLQRLAGVIDTYGPIADWDVSAITDMRYLFYNLRNFNADISSWDTSSVTDMSYMFYVRSPRVPLAPKP